MPGVVQVSVNPKIGLSFASALRALLRQDPDIMLIGEIRDPETANIAIHAALTGHLVLATLHTNDAASAITRLADLGVPSYLVATTVRGILAQRLLRKTCRSCGTTREMTADERARFAGTALTMQVTEGAGCTECFESGYRGRVPIFELLASERLKRVLTPSSNESAPPGFRSLWEDGLQKICEGSTTPSELFRAVI